MKFLSLKKSKKKKKKKRKEAKKQEASKMLPNEVESKKGIYYDHQSPPGSLFCLDKNGDQENRIFKKIYNGELPLYKPLYKFTGTVCFMARNSTGINILFLIINRK